MIKNKDIKILVDVESLLHYKLKETNASEEDFNLWVEYWNLIEIIIQNKKNITKKVNQKNKTIYKERHKLNNKISYLRNKKNKTIEDLKEYNKLIDLRKELNNKKNGE